MVLSGAAGGAKRRKKRRRSAGKQRCMCMNVWEKPDSFKTMYFRGFNKMLLLWLLFSLFKKCIYLFISKLWSVLCKCMHAFLYNMSDY